MTKLHLHQIVPTAVMTVATIVPIATAAELLAHAANPAASPSLVGHGAPASSTNTGPQNAASSGSASTQTTAPAPTATARASSGPQTYTGPAVDNNYGPVQATITVSNGKITNVSISAPQDSFRSASINSQAVPLLQSETLQAQSANINTISGATYTSLAYQQSLQGALDQAHIK